MNSSGDLPIDLGSCPYYCHFRQHLHRRSPLPTFVGVGHTVDNEEVQMVEYPSSTPDDSVSDERAERQEPSSYRPQTQYAEDTRPTGPAESQSPADTLLQRPKGRRGGFAK
jgi:hypothetical protein